EHLLLGLAYPMGLNFVHNNEKYVSCGDAKGRLVEKILEAVKTGSETVTLIDLYGLMPEDASTKSAVGPDGDIIAPSYRYVQPLNGRKIYMTEGLTEEVNLYRHRICDGLSSCGDS
ncbi:hypothetical protein FOZ63_030966, partial [Perkinsus olseni]